MIRAEVNAGDFVKNALNVVDFTNKCIYNYFLIPTSNKNNLIYLFITQTHKEEIKLSFCSS